MKLSEAINKKNMEFPEYFALMMILLESKGQDVEIEDIIKEKPQYKGLLEKLKKGD